MHSFAIGNACPAARELRCGQNRKRYANAQMDLDKNNFEHVLDAGCTKNGNSRGSSADIQDPDCADKKQTPKERIEG